jgi:hypothetical protein
MPVPKFTQIAIHPANPTSFKVLYGLGEDGRVYCLDYNKFDKEFGWRLITNEMHGLEGLAERGR